MNDNNKQSKKTTNVCMNGLAIMCPTTAQGLWYKCIKYNSKLIPPTKTKKRYGNEPFRWLKICANVIKTIGAATENVILWGI